MRACLRFLVASLVLSGFVGPDRWHGTSGVIRRNARRLGFSFPLGLLHLLLRPSWLVALDAGSRRIGQIDEAARHPADVVEQLAPLLPDRLGVSLSLAHPRLRPVLQRREVLL